MDLPEVELKLRDAERRILALIKEVGVANRMAMGKREHREALHAEGQFYRRIREFCNRELAEIEDNALDLDHLNDH